LAVGGWRLAAGGWRLAAGGWRLADGFPPDPRLAGAIVFAMILLGLAFSGHFSPKQFSQM
jgi:hypothetical protein